MTRTNVSKPTAPATGKIDANDFLYQVNASRNYDPSPQLEKIPVPVMWMNSADDFINPPDLGIAEREVKRLKNGKFILIPARADARARHAHVRRGVAGISETAARGIAAMNDTRIVSTRRQIKLGGAQKLFVSSAVVFFIGLCAGTTALAQSENTATNPGQALYREHCGSCHDGGASRAPSRAALEQMSVENIRFALTKGSMSSQGATLTAAQVDALAGYLSKLDELKAQGPTDTNLCPQGGAAFNPTADRPHWNGWGVDPAQHRFQPAPMAGLSAEDIPKLKLRWAFGYDDANQAYAQPTIMGGRVFVGSAARKVYSIDARTGCIYWRIRETDSPVRTTISVGGLTGAGKKAGAHAGEGWAAYSAGKGAGNVYAVDAATGRMLWKTAWIPHPDVHVTGAPTLADGRLYVGVSSLEEVSGADAKDECCKLKGSVPSLDAATGKVMWKTYTIPEAGPRRCGKIRTACSCGDRQARASGLLPRWI